MSVKRQLSTSEFEGYFQAPMANVTTAAEAVVDIWPYVDALNEATSGDIDTHDVSFVYRHPNERWDHVLIDTCAENVHLVVVIDRKSKSIIGHHLLNLNEKYGLSN